MLIVSKMGTQLKRLQMSKINKFVQRTIILHKTRKLKRILDAIRTVMHKNWL